MKRIYFDNASTTRLTEPVLEAMMPYLTGIHGNAMSAYLEGRAAREAVETARIRVARAIGAEPDEIRFTGGGTESDNWAVLGTAARAGTPGKIVTSAVEHHAVLRACEFLAKRGWTIEALPVSPDGFVDPEDLERAITGDTRLVSVMLANNEIGTVQPVRALAEIAHSHGVPFHTDAVQAVGALRIDVKELGADLLSVSGHKFHAPKGVGALYIRKGTGIQPLLRGGAQEGGLRAGTENVPGIVGIGAAIELAAGSVEERAQRVRGMRDALVRGILESVPGSFLNGSADRRLPGNANLCLRPLDSPTLVPLLDMRGIAASNGSACAAGSDEPSHVLKALGIGIREINGSIRFTLNEENTMEEVLEAVSRIRDIASRLP